MAQIPNPGSISKGAGTGGLGKAFGLGAAAAVLLVSTAAAAPPPAVTVLPVERHDVSPSTDLIARIQAIHSVDLRAQAQGYLQQVAFKDGQDVHAGDLLYVIEPGLYEAQLAAAQAQLAQNQANLAAAQRNLTRNQELARRGNVAQATLDQAIAQHDAAAAQVAAAQAAIKTAQINLGYTRITAPIDGRIGATAVTAGNLVGPSSGVLATIVQLDPIRVVFSVNQRDYVAFRERNPTATQEQIGARFLPSLRLPDNTLYPKQGRIEFINNTVDPATGTITVYADFPNPDRVLLPGMVATAIIRPEQPQSAITVPVAAVLEDQQGRYVLTVDRNDRVAERRIQVSRQIGQQWIVTGGLEEGDEIIVEGLQKARPGEVVKPVPRNQAAAQ